MKKLMLIGSIGLALTSASVRAGLLYEPDAYVQDGLVLQLDGIRNAGANAPHDANATVWANLAGGGGATKTAYTGTGKNSSGTGRWLDNAFYMDADWYFKTIGVIPASESVTVEVFGDFTPAQPTTYPNFISVADGGSTTDCGIWMNGGALKWKLDSYGFTGSTRPTISSWDKQGFAAALDASQVVLYASGATVSNTQTGRTSGKTFPACQWNIGCNWQAGNHPGKGTYYAVRIYTNTLTQAQIAANWQLDQYRFVTGIPVTNAVVATSLEGATGPEGVGAFAVDEDGYTFRAPACAAVGGTTYALVGCTVAEWDSSTGDWGAAEIRDGVFAVSLSSSDKVKITWQWEEATGSLDVGYLTEGLALRLDGIDNAGVGVHDASAAVWKDLSGNGRDAYLAGNADGTSHWTDKGFYFNRNAVFATTAQFQLGNAYTIEGLVDSSQSDYPDAGVNGQVFCNSVNYLANGNPSYYGNLYYHRNQTKWIFLAAHVTDATWGAAHTTLTDATLSYFTAFRDGPLVSLTNSAALPPSGQWAGSAKDDVPPDDIWCFGANSATAVRSGNQWNFKGTFKSFRAYTRLLTDEELAHNRAVDDARFFGNIPETGCVVVQSAIDGLEGREPSGTYFPDGWTFSAGAGTQTARGIEWQCVGYQLQTWDAASSAWGAQVTVLRDGSNAVEYSPSGTSFASVRLTWLWKPVSGIRTAADYALADYAAGGMQLHLDGLLNAGTAHDSSATVWSDLSGNGRDATLAGNPSGESHWVDNGYFFASNAVFTTDNSTAGIFSLGHAYTMQTLGEVNFADLIPGGATHNGTFVSPISHVGYGSIWLKGDGMGTIQHHTSDTTGAAWDLRGSVYVGTSGRATYLTALRNGNRAALVEGSAYPTTENTKAHQACMDWSVGSKDEAASATRWGVGALTGGGGGDPLYGTIKSVRLYDRMLSEDELAWNRSVDNARYFGALAVTNVVIETKYGDGTGETLAEGVGAYEVFGAHTFSATEVKDSSEALKPVAGCYVWTWKDGAWSEKTKTWHEGTSYDYTKDMGTVKIMWSPRPKGLVLVVR
ncbi:MAG: hypothetical protein IJ173_09295 [Kiritimatiellae bacterium]|nr:hypothetical protein [Kiritimatiellia bacterium]